MAEENPPRRRDFPGALFLGGARRLLRRTESRAADLAHGALFLAARGIRLPEALEHHRRIAQGCAKAWEDRDDPRERRRLSGARALGRIEAPGKAGERTVSAGPDKIIREDIRAIKAYHVQPADGLVKLDAMESPYGLPQPLQREIAEALSRVELNRYPDPTAPALVRRLRETMDIGAEYDILLGNGSDEIIHIIVQSIARRGAVVMAARPSFVMFGQYADFAGLEYVGVMLKPDFRIDIGAFLEALDRDRPAVVFIAYPNNPSGNLFDEESVARIIAAAPGLVVVDEAYHAFARKTFMTRLAE